MRKQLIHWSRFVVLAALALSGCFRPAGDSIEPTSNNPTSEQVIQPVNVPTATTTGLPPVTLLSADTPVATATLPLPVITEITLAPATQTFTATEPGQASDTTTTPTLQIITPGFSMNLITPDTPTPLPMDTLEPNSDNSSGVNMGATADVNGNSGNPAETLVSGADCTYTVESGDNLYRIAVLNDVTVADMQSANPDLVGDAPILQPGQVLKLPNCVPGEGTTTPSPTTESNGTPVPAASQDVYTVRSGDTLGAIASRYGISLNALMAANDLSDPNRLSIGQSLVIPAKKSS